MKIVSLQATNIKRLSAVEITPSGHIVDIGGKNRAGKSSVLDSIAYALGGLALVPEEPIRHGESEALVKANLGDFVVVRRFYRETIEDPDTKAVQFGETKSTLTVKSPDGSATFSSPQAMLDKLLGDLTFDPHSFAKEKPKVQEEILRRITNLDTSLIDRQRDETTQKRAILKKNAAAALVRIGDMPDYVEAPPAELSLDAIEGEMAEVERLRGVATELRTQQSEAQRAVTLAEDNERSLAFNVEQLKKQLAEAEAALVTARGRVAAQKMHLKVTSEAADAAVAAVPGTEELREALNELMATNAKVRQNAARRAAEDAHKALVAEIDEETALIEEFDRLKQEMVASVKFPVAGLGFSDDGVTLNGLPFAQASHAEQLTVSVAIGLALNSKLRILLVRNGESLDSDSMKLLAELAEKHDAQLWVERMTESKDGASVMIEDGHIAVKE